MSATQKMYADENDRKPTVEEMARERESGGKHHCEDDSSDDDNTKLCKTCNTVKRIDLFPIRKGKPYYLCITCNRSYKRKTYHNTPKEKRYDVINKKRVNTQKNARRRNNPEAFLHMLHDNMKRRHIAKTGSISGCITFDELTSKAKDAMCYYSGRPLVFTPHNRWQITPDRIDNTKGYTEDNFVLCGLLFNNRSNWTREKYDLVFDKRKKEEYIKKNTLDIHNPDFWRTGGNGTPYGIMYSLASNMNTVNAKRDCDYRWTFHSVVEHFKGANGLCFYSGMPMQFGTGADWLVSRERKDPRGCYTPDNLVFCCLEFNAIDRTRDNLDKTAEPQGWTKELVQELTQ
jgi:hypothetical protein